MSYSVKLTDEILISGFAAIQPNSIFSHRQIIADNREYDSVNAAMNSAASAVIDAGGLSEVTFDLTNYIGKKGLRFHDRSSKLTLAAIQAAFDETGLLQRYPGCDLNLVVGSDGALRSQNDVVREAMLSPKLLNPKAYPNRGCNVIAGQASLMFGLRGESTVISAGYRSGIDALIYAVRKVLVASRPVSYLVAAGEALSDARALRKKYKTCAGSDYIAPIEAAVALSVERAIEGLPSQQAYQVIGYQQTSDPQGKTSTAPEAFLQAFLKCMDYRREAIDAVIVGLEDRLQVQTQGKSYLVPYDVFGATALLHLLETIGFNPAVNGDDPPQTIVLSQADRYGCISTVLLKRKYSGGSHFCALSLNPSPICHHFRGRGTLKNRDFF